MKQSPATASILNGSTSERSQCSGQSTRYKKADQGVEEPSLGGDFVECIQEVVFVLDADHAVG
jgi:hypothetical protein